MIKRIIFDLDNTLIMWKDEYEKAADIALNVINYPKTNDLYKKINEVESEYEEGKTKDKKYRFQPQMVKRYQLRIKTLEYVQNIEELYAIRSFHYEVLKGDKAGISSIRVNDQYRIEFTVKQSTSETVVTICNILELSNHYK